MVSRMVFCRRGRMLMGFQKFDDLQVPKDILECKECKRIILDRDSKYCPNCGRKLLSKEEVIQGSGFIVYR